MSASISRPEALGLEGEGEVDGDGGFPTPPLPLATAMMCLTPGTIGLLAPGLDCADGAGC